MCNSISFVCLLKKKKEVIPSFIKKTPPTNIRKIKMLSSFKFYLSHNCSRYKMLAWVRFPVRSNNTRSITMLIFEFGNWSINSNTEEFPGHLNVENCSFGPAVALGFEDRMDTSEPKWWAKMAKTIKIWQRNLHRPEAKASQ